LFFKRNFSKYYPTCLLIFADYLLTEEAPLIVDKILIKQNKVTNEKYHNIFMKEFTI
jgi:hypothetical protein